MRWIYISPHFDDAILSCGGLIFEQTRAGIPVEIWTVCAGIPPTQQPLSDLARRIHIKWGTRTARGTIILRRREDKTAGAAVGASIRFFNHIDCIYRRGQDGAPLYTDDVFVSPHAEDAGIPDMLANLFKRALKRDDVIVCPLSVGHHVDHVLTRLGVERVGRSLLYYADTPYVLNHPHELEIMSKGMAGTLYPITEMGMDAWHAGMTAYQSQLETLNVGATEVRAAVREYWLREKGIRLYKPA